MNVLANSFNSYLQAKWLRLSKKNTGQGDDAPARYFFEDDRIICWRRYLLHLHLSTYQLQLRN